MQAIANKTRALLRLETNSNRPLLAIRKSSSVIWNGAMALRCVLKGTYGLWICLKFSNKVRLLEAYTFVRFIHEGCS